MLFIKFISQKQLLERRGICEFNFFNNSDFILKASFQCNFPLWSLNITLQHQPLTNINLIILNLSMSQSISRPLNESIKESIEPTVIKASKIEEPQPIVEEVQGSIASRNMKKMKKLVKRFKILAGCGICLLALGLIMFLAITPMIASKIMSSINEQLVLTPDAEDTWAHYPGASGTTLTRNYSFFTLMNEQQFLLNGEKPKFKEIFGYKLQEFEDFYDIKYNEDMTKVRMKDWLHFEVYKDSKNIDQKVRILNIPSLGYWFTLKKSRDAIIFIEAFSLLFTNIESSIIDTVIGQGVSSQYLPDFDTAYAQLLQPAGISKANSQFIWNDDAYGLRDKNNLKYWINAGRTSFTENEPSFSASALDLQDYFTLSALQLYFILNQFNEYAESLEDLIIKNHYCQGIQKCSGRELAIRQMAQSFVTYNTPPVSSIAPTDTICQNNDTCIGYFPELSAYYKRVYMVQHPQQDPYLNFDVEMVRKWLNYNPTEEQGQYNKAESALFHIGNLDALFGNGTLHDKTKQSHKEVTEYLKNLQSRFELQNESQTRVFWEWIKYLITNLFKQKTGTNQKLGMANSFSSTIQSSFTYLQDNLQVHVLKAMIKNKIQSQNCNDFLTTSFQNGNIEIIKNICNYYGNKIDSDEFVSDSISICRSKFKQSWIRLQQLGATPLNLESFCDENVKNGFGQLYNSMRIQLNTFYDCDTTPNQYCSDYELALKQWANSTVTLNHPPAAGNSLQRCTTFASWDSKAKPIEYYHYRNKFPQVQFPNINIKDAYHLFNYDNIFSASVNIRTLKDTKTHETWRNYMRYIIIFIGLRGFTNQRTARQHILGYNDEYLLQRKKRYPPFGGDPSTSAYIAFNDLNMTKENVTLEIQWWTGKDDISKVGQYSQINNFTYLTTNYTRFNGNETYWVLESPWGANDYFYGTSGKRFKPDQFGNNNISIYVPNIQRYGTGVKDPTQQVTRYGYSGQLARLGQYMYKNKYQNPDNIKYYQEYYGIFNETSVLGVPFYMTKHYFLDSSANWTTFVQYYNDNGEIIKPVDTLLQNSYVAYEPYTGLSFQSVLYLQANYMHEPDELFTYNQTCMLPVFTVNRAGNMTEETANKYLGPLVTALKVKTAVFVIGIISAVLGTLTMGFGVYKVTKLNKELGQKKPIKRNQPDSLYTGSQIGSQVSNKKDDDNSLNKPLMKEVQIEDDE